MKDLLAPAMFTATAPSTFLNQASTFLKTAQRVQILPVRIMRPVIKKLVKTSVYHLIIKMEKSAKTPILDATI